MTTTLFDHLATGAKADGQYPLIDNEYDLVSRPAKGNEPILDRVQVVFGEDRYGILVRHHTEFHWCGYVALKSPMEWSAIKDQARASIYPRISFCDYGNEYITWMRHNAKHRLKDPVRVFPAISEDGDFWVGFNTRYGFQTRPEAQEALAFLLGFEDTIHKLIHASRNRS